jgi:two-component system, chemotaxis family, CheB/CheR fusion protein
VIVIDRQHKIQIWNSMSTELWGLRADEVENQDLTQLDIGLPVNDFENAIARSFGGAAGRIEERVEAMNRRGQRFSATVRVMPLRTRADEIYASMILVAPDPATD